MKRSLGNHVRTKGPHHFSEEVAPRNFFRKKILCFSGDVMRLTGVWPDNRLLMTSSRSEAYFLKDIMQLAGGAPDQSCPTKNFYGDCPAAHHFFRKNIFFLSYAEVVWHLARQDLQK